MALLFYWLLVFLMAAVVVAAWAQSNGALPNETGMPYKTIAEVLHKHTDRLLVIPGVVGVAQGLCDGQPCIKVYLIKMTPELTEKIPKLIEGFPVGLEETGEIRALNEKES